MKNLQKQLPVFAALMAAFIIPIAAQRDGRTTFTGTAIIYGTGTNIRTVNRTFKLDITGVTPASESQSILSRLREDGQKELLDEIDDRELGRFSLGGHVGKPVNMVLVEPAENGKQRIRVIFARWIGFGELRYGARSVDYPFSYVELVVDPRTGRGEGTYYQAAKLRARRGNTLEIEDFGTFPSRLLGVSRSGRGF